MANGFIDRSQEQSANYPLEKLIRSRKGLREEIDFTQEGRIPPSAIEVEQEVLGSILISTDAIERVINVFAEESDTIFYEYKHRAIYKAMLRLYNRREAIDLVTMSDELKRNEELEKVGGYYYLAELSNKVATAANVEYYAIIVKEKYLYRRLISVATQVSRLSYDQSQDVFELIEQASQEVFKISQAGIKKKASDIKSLLKEAVGVIQTLQSRKTSVTGVTSGFTDLDKLTAGFQPSDLIIVAARPSTGKTALSLAFARNAAVEAKVPVLFFSLEMAELQLAMRMLCAEAMADAQDVRTGKITSAEMTNIAARMDRLSQSEILIDDTAGISIIELAAKARRLKQERNIGMIIVDYLQLIQPVKDGKTNREQEIAQISRTLKALAKELKIPVIALAQLNRSVENRGGDRKPQLSDLRESGSIEQDADVIMFLSRPEVYGTTNFADGSSTKDVIEVLIGKQRNGPTGEIRLKFLKNYGRFESMTNVYSASDFAPREEQKMIGAAEQITRDNPPPKPDEPTVNTDDAPF
ncbi:MAG: replicative DNA helicase [Rhizobacter sp.]|nr:replicative DNA helicase [Chlorobiales bacterium]